MQGGGRPLGGFSGFSVMCRARMGGGLHTIHRLKWTRRGLGLLLLLQPNLTRQASKNKCLPGHNEEDNEEELVISNLVGNFPRACQGQGFLTPVDRDSRVEDSGDGPSLSAFACPP